MSNENGSCDIVTSDPTEAYRKERIAELNSGVITRENLEAKYGQVWTTDEMQKEFSALGFMAPFIVVSKKDTGEKGSLEFTHSPRFYFGWTAK